jgi:hypothetical protein
MSNQRATNLELQKWIVRRHGFEVESSWLDGFRNQAENKPAHEGISAADVSIPPERVVAIRQAFRHFGMLR